MKKLIISLFFVLLSVIGFGQGATPTYDVRVANATTAFGVNISRGMKVYDLNTKNLYACDVASASTLTLTTGSANFTLVGGTSATHNPLTLGTANGLSLSTQQLSLGAASTSTTGALTSTDWNTFNSKEPAVTKGNLTEATSSVLTISSGTGAVIGAGTSIQVKQANTSQSGYLSNTDWNTFNGKLSSEVDGSVSNEGALSVTAGSGTTSVIHSNTSGSTDVTVTAGTGLTIFEDGSSGFTLNSTAKTAIVEEYEVAGDSTGHCILTLTNTPVTSSIVVRMGGGALKSTTQWSLVETKKVRMPFTVYQYEKFTISYSY